MYVCLREREIAREREREQVMFFCSHPLINVNAKPLFIYIILYLSVFVSQVLWTNHSRAPAETLSADWSKVTDIFLVCDKL